MDMAEKVCNMTNRNENRIVNMSANMTGNETKSSNDVIPKLVHSDEMQMNMEVLLEAP